MYLGSREAEMMTRARAAAKRTLATGSSVRSWSKSGRHVAMAVEGRREPGEGA